MLVFALAVIVLERALRGRARFYQAGAKGFLEPVVLRGGKRWLATGACLAVLSAAFLLPVYRLLTWTKLGGQLTVTRYLEHMGRSLTLAGAGRRHLPRRRRVGHRRRPADRRPGRPAGRPRASWSATPCPAR